ncbi:TonB-dependent receptor [Flavivirga aquimarina]|uniref:TonB-dependent receptor n=1 Tax=Flavivirga aquimarina TaxID=2027862 RepID=A0ABT8WCD9_9FLAO|nr:TonB-dependent receptor [Flavivirga aquimarina]MDO5970718.1 TonB-dependent receptor [Flavivirga aquimarina]
MKKICTSITILCFLVYGFGQTGNIKGKIIDTEGKPVEFANVILNNTQKGTMTDINGNYSIKAIETGEYILSASYITYKTLEKSIIIKGGETLEVDFILEANDIELYEVVVSAGRTSEKLSEVPASITVVGLKELKNLGTNTTNISDILEFAVPGLAPSTGTFSSWGQSLRGRRALVMVDGIPQSTPLRNGLVDIKSVLPNDISRVEVLKGAAAIYGNGGDGGIINYITKNANKNIPITGSSNVWTTSNLSKTDDAFGWGVQQSLNGGLDKVSYYISGSFEKTGTKYDGNGDIISPTYGLDNTKIFSVLGKIGYEINDKQTVDVMFNHYKSSQETPYVAQLGALEIYNASGDYKITPTIGILPTAENPISEEAVGSGITTTNAQLKYELSEIFNGTTKFAADLYYQKGKNIFFYDATYFDGGGQTVVNTDKLGFRPILNTKLNLEFPLTISFTYGLDLLKDKTNQGLLDGRIWAPNLDLLSIAPFVQAKFKFKEDWVFKAGLRYEDMSVTIKDFSTLPVSPTRDDNFTNPIDIEGGELEFSNTSLNVGIRYIKNDEFIPYASFSQGFTLPDIGRVVRGGTSTNVNNINPQAIKTNNYEFGFLSKFKHVRFEAVGYYSTSNLGLNLIRIEDTDQLVQSMSPQSVYGAEVSTDFTFLDDHLQFGVSYSYVEGLEHDPEDATTLTYIGGDVISPAKTTAYINVRPLKKLSTSLRLIHVGDRERFNVNENEGVFTYSYTEVPVTGYTLVNFSSSYKATEKISISLGINNLFNKFFLPPRSQWASTTRTYNSAGEGVNGRLAVSYNF